ncbi:hypothetical protein LIZ98_17585, partial [Caldibacillus sp. 210928-DFI.2.18]|uniref:hypothetical protein n=1 Tax=Caldibacillus sp. 210928-DFI.2.18 TaxID=2883264 RepID=UPI001D067AD6
EVVSSPKNAVLRLKKTTRKDLVAKKRGFTVKKGDEKRSRSQKSEVSRHKTTTRSGLVAKKCGFSAQNDDEKWSRRQKVRFPGTKRRREVVSSPKYSVSGTKRRREKVSSPKNSVFRLKTTTRKGLVAKKVVFALQNDDEKWSRRQKMRFCGTKRRREVVSSPKKKVSRLQTTTRSGLVAKKVVFALQKDDEKWSRRQKVRFRGTKRRREVVSSPKNAVLRH